MQANELISRVFRAAGSVADVTTDFDLNPEAGRYPPETLRDAGVLIAIRPDGQVYLTKRASSLKHHPGQIALPGGKVDPGDDGAVGAALREAEEEIGLPRSAVEVRGVLAAHETITRFRVTPVLAAVTSDFDAKPEPGEVDEVFAVPIPHLLDVANYRKESRIWQGQRRFFYVVPYGPYYIWGATARIFRALADRVPE